MTLAAWFLGWAAVYGLLLWAADRNFMVLPALFLVVWLVDLLPAI